MQKGGVHLPIVMILSFQAINCHAGLPYTETADSWDELPHFLNPQARTSGHNLNPQNDFFEMHSLDFSA
jgi:hypothetical protein